MTKNYTVLLVSLIASQLMACSAPSNTGVTTSTSTNATGYSSQLTHQEEKTKSSFLSVYNRWEGVPYRLGGNTFQGIDCSAFVQIAYRDALSVDLPRTTLHQSKVGWSINYNDAEVGDLVFFRTSRTTRHVGVYLGDRQFLHASTSRGVIISRVDNPYWASKFWHFRRVTNSPKVN